MMYAEAGSILSYFLKKAAENPSFYSAMQLDCDEKITNMCWADAKMLIDYAHFGDVITFDTTFGTNKDCRPLGVFVGFNQLGKMVVFGAALLYDEIESYFKWLFETFLEADKQKYTRTIYTDQDMAMKNAISMVFSESWHGLCTFHIMQNVVKHLARMGRDESSALAELSACMDVKTFEETFSSLRTKVTNDTWLGGLYQQKEKWAECYMMNIFTLGMRSTQLSESLNKDMKDVLKCDLDIAKFFTHFERVVASKRAKELDAEYNSRKKLPRIQMNTPILIQARNMYTTCIFEAFQTEYERSLDVYARPM
jgi:zinc finger SWIM domain-containing protein 3